MKPIRQRTWRSSTLPTCEDSTELIVGLMAGAPAESSYISMFLKFMDDSLQAQFPSGLREGSKPRKTITTAEVKGAIEGMVASERKELAIWLGILGRILEFQQRRADPNISLSDIAFDMEYGLVLRSTGRPLCGKKHPDGSGALNSNFATAAEFLQERKKRGFLLLDEVTHKLHGDANDISLWSATYIEEGRYTVRERWKKLFDLMDVSNSEPVIWEYVMEAVHKGIVGCLYMCTWRSGGHVLRDLCTRIAHPSFEHRSSRFLHGWLWSTDDV